MISTHQIFPVFEDYVTMEVPFVCKFCIVANNQWPNQWRRVRYGTAEDQARGIQWTPSSVLGDLDFADDLALVSHIHQHTPEKNPGDQKISLCKLVWTLTGRKKKWCPWTFQVAHHSTWTEKNLPTIDVLTYQGSIVRHDGGAGHDMTSRIN